MSPVLFQLNAEMFYERFSRIPGLTPVMPHGAMYMMVSVIAKFYFSSDKSIKKMKKLFSLISGINSLAFFTYITYKWFYLILPLFLFPEVELY